MGRDRELAELAAALSNGSGGLLTITGPGGTGKTRLALELAARIAPRFADGVHFVALAPVRDPSLVASTIAQAIGLRESGVLSLEELVEQRLHDGELFLLLDNVEHLVPAASPLLARLAQAAHGSRLVLTSRAAVGVSGEQEYPLEPLSEPDAARLFEERARAVKPSLELDAEVAAIVASICNKLDGLPLAIELAAARVRLMSPKAILARLDERLTLLTGGPADAPARQQTLRATIDWSYQLLEPEQKQLFAGLSVFPAGARLEALEAVCHADLDALDGLVRHSLVVAQDDRDAEPRFSMLETIREYATEQLGHSGRAEEVRDAHVTYVVQLAEQAAFHGPQQLEWLERFDAEHDNIRAALDRALGRDAETATHLAAATWEYWWARGHLREGRDRLGRVVAATSRPSLERTITLFADANLARDLGRLGEGLQICREVLPLFEGFGDRFWIAQALLNLGTLEWMVGDHGAGRRHVDQAIAVARESRDDFVLGNCLSNLGWSEIEAGELVDAASHLEEAIDVWRRGGNEWGVALAESNLGCALATLGDVDRADELLRRSLPALARLGMPWLVCSTLDELGISVARARGNDPLAARLLGARDRLGVELGLTRVEHHTRAWFTDEAAVNDLRETLGASAFEAAYEEGRAMSLEQVVDSAVGLDSREDAG